MNRKNIVLLFDVDGTLTKPRQAISPAFKKFLFDEVQPLASIGVVSGSDYPKIIEQLGGPGAVAHFDYVFSENGLVHHRKGNLVSQESILKVMGEKKLQKLINFALGYLSKVELPTKRGHFVEFRSSMINISPVGRSCNQAEREEFAEYDAKHKVRARFVEALEREFEGSDLTFALGGQISVDIFPVGWDKTYCLRHIADEKFDEIHFFGDKTKPGGNDYEIYYDPRTIGHEVTSPKDTEEQLRQLLNISTDCK